MQILHPKHWARAKGFANGIAAEGRQVFVAGQVGWNAEQQFASDDFVAQVEQALRNIVAILAEAGARPEHLVAMVIGGGLRMAMGGVVVGGIAAVIASRSLNALVYDISTTSPGKCPAATYVCWRRRPLLR